MSEYLAIVADVKAKMESINGIGLVHDYERQAKDLKQFILLFARDVGNGEKQILGWEITRRGFTEHKAGAFFRHHLMMIKGYMGLEDASGTSATFQVLVDDVCDKFRVAEPPAGATWQYYNGDEPDKSPVQGEVINDRMFSNYLCHCAEISLSVTERILA